MKCGTRSAECGVIVWSSEFGAIVKNALCEIIILMCIISFASPSIAAEKWPGVDESVVEKYAREHGREAWTPFINTDQGDLLLFVFLLAGSIGGFAAGYYWRILIAERAPKTGDKKQQITS